MYPVTRASLFRTAPFISNPSSHINCPSSPSHAFSLLTPVIFKVRIMDCTSPRNQQNGYRALVLPENKLNPDIVYTDRPPKTLVVCTTFFKIQTLTNSPTDLSGEWFHLTVIYQLNRMYPCRSFLRACITLPQKIPVTMSAMVSRTSICILPQF